MKTRLLGLLAGTAAVALAATAASAADLPYRAAAPLPVIAPVPVFTWTGFYVGVNAGYGWNTNDNGRYFDPVLGIIVDSESDGGFVGGGQIGYNYQVGSFVFGVETDIQYADIGGSNDAFVDGVYVGDRSGDAWFGTVRARAGVAFDRALIYVTGGLAYGDIGRGSSTYVDPVFGVVYGSNDDVSTGWTLGGGVEYAFTNNLTAKVEGLYVNLDTSNNNYFGYYADRNNAEFGVVRAGLNFKFGTY
ncbi:outer membrane protein [Microvirga sp. GCM10011540]|uniref:outer membrane protein n=1 Tax=Microvirga sp. GCM10011540 TaxID=3317338 RepID=UPI00360CC140